MRKTSVKLTMLRQISGMSDSDLQLCKVLTNINCVTLKTRHAAYIQCFRILYWAVLKCKGVPICVSVCKIYGLRIRMYVRKCNFYVLNSVWRKSIGLNMFY